VDECFSESGVRKLLYLEIQSPILQEALQDISGRYSDSGLDIAIKPVHHAPFDNFIQRWNDVEQLINRSKFNEKLSTVLKLLYDVLYPEVKDAIEARRKYIDTGYAEFRYLETLFPSGCTISGTEEGNLVALRVTKATKSQRQGLTVQFPEYLELCCEYIDWDGTQFGLVETIKKIEYFDGTLPMAELRFCPIEYRPNFPESIDKLVARGRRFEEYAGHHYAAARSESEMVYDEGIVSTTPHRIIIDTKLYRICVPVKNRRELRPIKIFDTVENLSSSKPHIQRGTKCWSSEVSANQDRCRKPLLPKDTILCWPSCPAYSLAKNAWIDVRVDDILDIDFDEDAYETLAIPQDQRELIASIAENQLNKSSSKIEHSKEGIVIFLHGASGTGKNLTARAIAEKYHAPLYEIDSKAMESDDFDIEYKSIGDMISSHSGVLLLKNADILMSYVFQDDQSDAGRDLAMFFNQLRYLKSYMVIMTTSKFDGLHDASRNRIHLTMNFAAFDDATRKNVWTRALHCSGHFYSESNETKILPHTVDDAELTNLAKLNLNGHEINNTIRIAICVAKHRQKNLCYSHLRTVLKAQGYTFEES
jgi:hypothetical protein